MASMLESVRLGDYAVRARIRGDSERRRGLGFHRDGCRFGRGRGGIKRMLIVVAGHANDLARQQSLKRALCHKRQTLDRHSV